MSSRHPHGGDCDATYTGGSGCDCSMECCACEEDISSSSLHEGSYRSCEACYGVAHMDYVCFPMDEKDLPPKWEEVHTDVHICDKCFWHLLDAYKEKFPDEYETWDEER